MLISFKGDASPRIPALQLLLNRFQAAGLILKVDGQYGDKTAASVQAFRGEVMLTSGRGDLVDGPVWERLLLGTTLQVVDVVDITDPEIMEAVVPDLVQFNVPVLMGAMSNGVAQAVNEIKARAKGD